MALWAFDGSDNFREGALLEVNLGDDADTRGAIDAQIDQSRFSYLDNFDALKGRNAQRVFEELEWV